MEYPDIYEDGVEVDGVTPIKEGSIYLFSKLNVPSRLFSC